MLEKLIKNFSIARHRIIKDEDVFVMFKKILSIIAILFIIALAISNYFNKPELENTITAQKVVTF